MSSHIVNLNDWIASKGGPAPVAELIGEKLTTVYSWVRLEKAPRWRTACRIVRVSGGAVDFNGIYRPFCEKHFPGPECPRQ